MTAPMDPAFVEAEPTLPLFETQVDAPVRLSGGSKISWTDYTFNPWWGCERVSPACTHCYAETFSHRLGMNLWGKKADRRFFGDKHWAEPLKWDRRAARDGVRRRVFCASMADVFEDRDSLEDERLRLWALIDETPHLDWLLLTKRPENIVGMVPFMWAAGRWPRRVWAGTTTEDQQRATERIPHLLMVPAPIRFLSAEPLLGPLDIDMADISLVITGGESGHGARPMHPGWVRDVRDRCADVGAAFHFKQWGEWTPTAPADEFKPRLYLARDGRTATEDEAIADGGSWLGMFRVGAKAAGRELDGRIWDEMPACTAWEAQ